MPGEITTWPGHVTRTPHIYETKRWALPCAFIWRICFTVSFRIAHLSGFTLKLSMSLKLAKISSASSWMYLFSCSRFRLSTHRLGLWKQGVHLSKRMLGYVVRKLWFKMFLHQRKVQCENSDQNYIVKTFFFINMFFIHNLGTDVDCISINLSVGTSHIACL